MGKKRKALTTNKYNGKRAAWLSALKETEVLTEQVEEAISVVQETNKKVADKTSTIELVEPVKPAKAKPVTKESWKVKKAVKRASTKKTTTKTAKKTTKE